MSDAILAWLELEGRILKATRLVEIDFAILNLGAGVVEYRQAALWQGGIAALSGVSSVDGHAPYALWLDKLMRGHPTEVPLPLDSTRVAAALAEQWHDWLPAHALVVPMGQARLLFARDQEFSPDEIALLQRLADLGRVARADLAPRRAGFSLPKTKRKRLIAAAALLAALFPVTGSVLAPAESVPAHPVVVRSPLDGVIDRVLVAPNQLVVEGDVLFLLDATSLTGRLDVARQSHATAEAEYRQAAQAMVFDAKAKAQVAILAGKAEEKAAEVRLLEAQLQRVQVRAPQAGIALFDDAADWIGRPVALGEKVMAVADEIDSEIEAWVSVADVGEVQAGGRVTVFLNSRPLSPLRAQVRSLAYEAVARPDNSIAHRLRASLDPAEEKPRLGLKGTARIDGDTVPLVWWLFRRPLATIRQFVGF